jgi:hypothetical protein
MTGFIGTSLQLQLIITAHTLNSFWTTSVWRISDYYLVLGLVSSPSTSGSLNFCFESDSYVTTDGQSANISSNKAPIWGLRPDLDYCQTVRVCWFGEVSLTRGRVCRLQLLLALAMAVILGSKSRGTRDHILLSQIRDFLFCRHLRLAGLRWRYSTPPPHYFYNC